MIQFNRITTLPTLETERLILRPFRMDDVDAWFEINKDPEVTKYTGDGGVQSKSEIERRIRDHVLADYSKHGFGRWAVIFKATNELIGFAGLKYMPDMEVVDLGYRFKTDYWGKGLATEASKHCIAFGFDDLGLERIHAYVLPDNKGSIRVLDKMNFQFIREFFEEGVLEHEYVLERDTHYAQ